jgi:hypothetical protein
MPSRTVVPCVAGGSLVVTPVRCAEPIASPPMDPFSPASPRVGGRALLESQVDGFTVGTFNFSCTRDCASTTCSIYQDGRNLGGTLPDVFDRLACASKIVLMNLGSNGIGGTVPASFSSLTGLTFLGFYDNNLRGTVPASFSALTNLVLLWFDGNQLGGTVPTSLSALTNLERLSFASNQLGGALPASFTSLDKLELLYAEDNFLTGSVPSTLLRMPNLTTFGCALRRRLPRKKRHKRSRPSSALFACSRSLFPQKCPVGQVRKGEDKAAETFGYCDIESRLIGAVIAVAVILSLGCCGLGVWLFQRTRRRGFRNRNSAELSITRHEVEMKMRDAMPELQDEEDLQSSDMTGTLPWVVVAARRVL